MRAAARVSPCWLAATGEFLSSATRETVVLGPVWVVTGAPGRLVTAIARASAITFGPIIFVSRAVAAVGHTDERGTWHPGRGAALLVHECVHVWQYEREGDLRFLSKYLYSYLTSIIKQRSLAPSARQRAYEQIPYEQEAFALERAWLCRSVDEDVTSNDPRAGS